MPLADAIPSIVAARAIRIAARNAERAARDVFIQAEFALLMTRFEALLAEAIGLTSRITTVIVPASESVRGRTFATLATRIALVSSTLDVTPQTVTFTPTLAFGEPDQFGRIGCTIDFAWTPRRRFASYGERMASALLRDGVVMAGSVVSDLYVRPDGARLPLTAADLEAALAAWWLR